MSGTKTRKYRLSHDLQRADYIGIKSKDSRHIYVPHYDTLTIKTIMDFLNDGRKQVFNYLPDLQELDKVAREWICNVCCTVLKEDFENWVATQI